MRFCTYLCTRHKKLPQPPTPKGAFALLFFLQFIPFRMVFLGRSPLKTHALFKAWSINALSNFSKYQYTKGFQHC